MNMKDFLKLCCGLLLLTGGLAACNSGPAPGMPTIVPTALVPTATPSPTAMSEPLPPSPTPTEEPMVEPGNTPTPTPGAAGTVGVSISDPSADMVLVLGDEVVVRGRAQLPSTARLLVTLLSYNWYPLAEAEANIGEVGWEATLSIPYNVGGNGRILAQILDEDENILANDQIGIWLEPDTDNINNFLLLNRPATDDVAVRGYNFLFDGTVFNPANNTVSIAIWAGEDCQLQVARQNFVLGSSANPFSWHGFIIVPGEAEGAACAIASFGQPGDAGWREIQVPITVFPTSAAEARQIEIARPLPQTVYRAGNQLFVYGTAPGITERVLQVSVLLENGRIIDENDIASDLWGYWEYETMLPPDVEGPAEITVSAGEPDEPGYVFQQILVNIEPGDPNAIPDPDEEEEP
jgi:hypothetical protein